MLCYVILLWHCMARHRMACYIMAWYGIVFAWYGMDLYGMTWYNLILYGLDYY